MIGGGDPLYLKFWISLDFAHPVAPLHSLEWSEIADFRSIFARGVAAVTPV